MKLRPDKITVSFEYRKRGNGDTQPAKWYAHIEPGDGSDHHGIGDSAAVALSNAAQHWLVASGALFS